MEQNFTISFDSLQLQQFHGLLFSLDIILFLFNVLLGLQGKEFRLVNIFFVLSFRNPTDKGALIWIIFLILHNVLDIGIQILLGMNLLDSLYHFIRFYIKLGHI